MEEVCVTELEIFSNRDIIQCISCLEDKVEEMSPPVDLYKLCEESENLSE